MIKVILVLLAGLFAAFIFGIVQQRRAFDGVVRSLLQDSGVQPDLLPLSEVEDLPHPVRRYLTWAVPEPRRIVSARLAQVGEVRTDPTQEKWMRFSAEHLAVPRADGFVWNARVSAAPFIHILVRDALVEGRGSGQVALMSAVPMGSESGSPEMNAGALHRYLAEAVWYPTALWPSERLRWTPIDENRALATLTSAGTEVSLEFRFGADGPVTGIYTPARWGQFDRGFRQVAWEGHFSDYELLDGVRVPRQGAVGWYVNGDLQEVWRGRITAVAFDFGT